MNYEKLTNIPNTLNFMSVATPFRLTIKYKFMVINTKHSVWERLITTNTRSL